MNVNPNQQSIDIEYESIADCAMVSVFNKRPYMFQKKVIAHLLKMINCTIHPQAILVVQSTGGGKSAIPQTTAVADGGVTIILENTLALSADQHSKIEQLKSDKIFAFHLDTVKSKADKESLSLRLTSLLERDDRISVILFTSPECIVDKIWIDMIKKLVDSNFLKLVCIDEVHQFVNFGLTFRKSFATLKEKLFKLLVNSNYSKDSNTSLYTVLKIPILFMTATMNQSILGLLQQIVGIQLFSYNIYWGDASYFNKRNITICSSNTPQYLRNVKKSIAALMTKDKRAKAIICSNTAKKLEDMQSHFDTWLDETGIDGDSVLVVGDIEQELKYAYTVAFTKTISDVDNQDISKNYTPKFLFGTSGCVGAGLDLDEVRLVIRLGMPTSIINLIQEMGRCGRKKEALSSNEPNKD